MTPPQPSLPDLLHAVAERDLDLLRAILHRAPGLRDATDEAGCTALIHAAHLDRPGAARLLVDAGADLEARDTIHTSTALGWAAYFGHVAVATLLVDAGADVDYINPYGLDPAQIAEGGARGEHEEDAPGRPREDFIAIVEYIAQRRRRRARGSAPAAADPSRASTRE